LGLDDVVVTALDYQTGEVLGSSLSFNEGEFIINGLSPRRYLLMFSGTYIIPFFFSHSYSWQDGDAILLDRNFTGVRTEAITQDYGNNGLAILGWVYGDGLPVEGARVYAFHFGQEEPAAYARTDRFGEYALVSGLEPGAYTVVCDMFGYDRAVYPNPVTIDLVQDPEAEDINFGLIPVLTGITADAAPRMEMQLAGNYPNPFNLQTVISFYSGADERFRGGITVFNLLGQMVGQKEIEIAPGINRIVWNMSNLGGAVTSGVYYYRISGSADVGRMILLK
jgi:hypothetical protein